MAEETKLPPEEEPEVPPAEESKLVEELQKMRRQPMLPVEKKLIGYSIVLGIILLFLFVWISYTFFPGTH